MTKTATSSARAGTPHARARRLPRGVTGALVAALTGVAAIGLLGLPLYVFPPVDAVPEQVDVVYVIGPATPKRVALAREIVDSGAADHLLISVSPKNLAGSGSIERFSDCNQPGGNVTCISPLPFTTGGEAGALARLAADRGWDSATVITFTPHVTRTRTIMHACVDGDVSVVDSHEAVPLGRWIYQYLYQTGAFAKLALAPDCRPLGPPR